MTKTPGVIRGAGKLCRRREPKIPGKKKVTNVRAAEQKEEGTNYDNIDALGLAKAWVILYQRAFESEETRWPTIAEICTKRFNMNTLSKSLRSK